MARPRKINKKESSSIFDQIQKEAAKTLVETNLSNLSEEKRKEIIAEGGDSIWESGDILNFRDFIRSPEHMNFPELSDRQYAVSDYILGDDPKKMFDNNRNTAVLVWGKGCVTEDCEIYTADGKRITAKESFEKNIPFFVWSCYNNEIKPFLSTPFIKKEKKEKCFFLITSNGNTIKVSEDHLFLSNGNWIKAKNINVNDYIDSVIGYDIKNLNPNISEEFAYISGILFSIFEEGKLKIKNLKIYDELSKYFNKEGFFGEISKKGYVSEEAEKFLVSKGFELYQDRVPLKFIFTSKMSRKSFLIGFLQNERKKKINIDLYKDLDFMFRSFGIVLRYDYKKNIIRNSYYRLLKNISTIKGQPTKIIKEKICKKIYMGEHYVYTPTVPISKNYVMCNFINHNSGKDTISALIQLYIVYVLLHLKSPQAFFDKGPQSSIDLLNIASTREQAQEVYFQLLKKFILNWSWLKNRYQLTVNGRFFSAPASQDAIDISNKVVITNESIIFPKNIQMFSGSSEADSSEGKNLICFVLDEADAFKSGTSRSAEKIYRVCRTSAFSRFKNKFKGFVISYPRSEKGFILSLYNSVKDDIQYYCDRAATWEVLPPRMFSKDTFNFNGVDIPIDFYEEFKMDPVGAQLAYMAVPVEESNKYIEIENLTTPFAEKERAIFEFKDYIKQEVDGKYVCKDIIYTPPKMPTGHYCISFDLAVKEDNCAICLAHLIEDKIIIDFVTAWVPRPDDNIKVSLANVNKVVQEMSEKVRPAIIGGDTWNSALLCQNLQSKGFNAKTIKITHDDYLLFRRFLLNGNVFIPKDTYLINEIKDLYYERYDKVNHPDGKHDDRFMACLIAFKSLLSLNVKNTNLMLEGEFIGDNLATSDDFIDSETLEENGVFIDNKFMINLDDPPDKKYRII